ncbi:MAG TPA: hypothetical protein DCX22_04515 [Dehalococcoidia bacterium]|nr:hypothetical protein [Dehalococcoidia bacterium]
MGLPDSRDKIDDIDAKIALLLSERIKLVKEIGIEKKRLGMAVVDADREHIVLQNIEGTTRNQGLNQAEIRAIRSIYKKIMEEAAKLESE